MPAKYKPFVVYPDLELLEKIEALRAYMSEKEGGKRISDGHIGRELITEKYREVIDKQNNRARITTLVERIDRLEAVVMRLVEMIERMEGDGR